MLHHPAHDRAGGDHRGVQLRAAGDPGRHPLRLGREDRPPRIIQDHPVTVEQLHVRGPVGLQSAQVHPIPVKAVLGHRAVGDEPRQKVVAVVLQLPVLGVQLLEGFQQFLGVVEEHLPGHQPALRLLGLVVETGHPPVVVDLHHTVAGGVLGDLGGDHGQVRTLLQVGVHDIEEVDRVEVISTEHQHQIRGELADQLLLPVDRVRVALGETLPRGPLVGGQHLQPAVRAVQIPGPPIGQVHIETVRQVLLHHPHIGDVRVRQIRQGQVNEPIGARHRQGRLDSLLGQSTQPGALPTGQHQGQNPGYPHQNLLHPQAAAPSSAALPPRRRRGSGPRAPRVTDRHHHQY